MGESERRRDFESEMKIANQDDFWKGSCWVEVIEESGKKGSRCLEVKETS